MLEHIILKQSKVLYYPIFRTNVLGGDLNFLGFFKERPGATIRVCAADGPSRGREGGSHDSLADLL